MREVGNFPLGCWVTLTRPDCFLASLALYFLGLPYHALGKTLIIVGHAPLYLIPFSLVFWFTVPVIFSYHSFIITPLISFCMYPYCIALCNCTFSPTSFNLPLGVYQRYTRLICATTLGIPLEYYIHWHNVVWMMDKEYLLHIIWIHGNYHLSFRTRMVIKGIGVSLHLSLHVYAMIVIEITCCVPWTTCFEIPLGCTKRIHWKTPSLKGFPLH